MEVSRKPLILEVRKPELVGGYVSRDSSLEVRKPDELVDIWPWGSPPKGSTDQRVEALGIRHPMKPLLNGTRGRRDRG